MTMNIRRWAQNTLMEVKVTDILLAILTLAAVIIAGLQWREMHTGGIDTARIAKAAADSSDAAKQNVAAADRFAKATEKLADQVGKAVEDLHSATTSLQTSAEAANAGVKTQVNQGRADQRAWLNIENATYNVDLIEHKITFRADSRDSGKSPALQAIGTICLMVRPGVLTEEEFQMSVLQAGVRCANTPVGAVAPNSTALLQTAFGNPFFATDSPIPVHVLYFYGILSYWDIFGREHRSSYCYMSSEDIDTHLATCGFKNTMT